jgi:hypothetical protein
VFPGTTEHKRGRFLVTFCLDVFSEIMVHEARFSIQEARHGHEDCCELLPRERRPGDLLDGYGRSLEPQQVCHPYGRPSPPSTRHCLRILDQWLLPARKYVNSLH